MIRAIEGEAVRRIAAGQVITDLCSCVKELVDNSLDAQTTKLDIILANWGLDWIEVQDDGCGIAASSFTQLGHPHRTSKLTGLDDLARLTTLGFRGEALHSLIAISSSVQVTTKTKTDAHGWELSFHGLDERGHLRPPQIKNHNNTMQTGTRVRVEGLLETYRVRRQDWQKQHKKALARLLWCLQAYAIGNPKVRFRITHRIDEQKTDLLFQTHGQHADSLSVATSLFGPAATTGIASLTSLSQTSETSPHFHLWCSGLSGGTMRSSADRQFVFCNGRPCDLPSLTKFINAQYREHGMDKYPFLILAIQVDPARLDVNVTPDKRTIYLHDEKAIIEQLKVQLDALIFSTLSLSSLQSSAPIIPKDNTGECCTPSPQVPSPAVVATSPTLQVSSPPGAVTSSTLPSHPIAVSSPLAQVTSPLAQVASRIQSVTSPPKPASPQISSAQLQYPCSSEVELKDLHASELLAQSHVQLHRERFKDLQVIGQFNCGFIMARLPETLSLFIIDQHAADERYRLEKYTAELSQTRQSLLKPKRLELAADELALIRGHLERLQTLGFGIEDEGDAVSLITAPCLGGILMNETGKIVSQFV